MTSTRLGSCAMTPPPALPALVTQLAAFQHAAVFVLELEQRDGAVAAPHGLAAGFVDRAHDRADDLTRRCFGGHRRGRERAGPDRPAPLIEPAESPRVRSRQRAHEVVD